MVKTWTDVNSHGPYFFVLRITVWIDCRLWITSRFTATVSVSTRSAAAAGPVNTGHVQIHIICNLNIWIVFLHPIICPEVTSTLSTLFTRPQTEHHGVTGVVIGHCFCNSEHHARTCSVVISPYTGSVGSAENMRVQHTCICRWSDVKVGTKNHPLIWINITVSISTDVVGFGVLSTRR